MARKSRKWSFTAGERPNQVTVYERDPGGALYVRVWDQSKRGGRGNWIRRSLGHDDRDRAKAYALAEAAKLEAGSEELKAERVTLGRVLALYRQYRTPRKSEHEQRTDERRAEMWARVLGAGKDPHKVSMREWEDFIDARSSGAIDARGEPVPVADRSSVRARTVEADCRWLGWVFNWASKWRMPDGRYLMRENPLRGYETPREENPRRPVASHDRFEAIRAVSDQVMVGVRRGRGVPTQRSYLSELLDIINGTGRRLSAVCALRYEDLRLSQGRFGSIRWPADTDKQGRETLVPLGPEARAAIDRILQERPGIGRACLFPSPEDPEKPISRHLASKWLVAGEQLAGLEPQQGSRWHAYRRKWATERKHLPDVDVAAAGGWASLEALKRSYQQADQETMLQVVLGGGELREQA